MTERAARDILAGWGSDRAEPDYLRDALAAQPARSEEYVSSMGWSLDRMEELDREKSDAYTAALKKKDAEIAALERRKWIPGVIVGAGITSEGTFKGMIGIGWKF